MTDNEKLIDRLRAVIDNALGDSMSVENDRVVTQAEHDGTKPKRCATSSLLRSPRPTTSGRQSSRNASMMPQATSDGKRVISHTPTDDEREALVEAIDEVLVHWGEQSPSPYEVADGVLAAGFRRTEVPEPSGKGDEFAQEECDGSGACPARRHIHGCYTRHRADQCDSPDDYGHLPNDGEMTNRACWKCGWARVGGGVR